MAYIFPSYNHNVIEAWETMLKTGGWKRCQPKW